MLRGIDLVRKDAAWQRILHDVYDLHLKTCDLQAEKQEELAKSADPNNVTPQEVDIEEKYEVKFKELQEQLNAVRARQSTLKSDADNPVVFRFRITRKTGCKAHLVPSRRIADIRNRMRKIREATMSFAQSCGSRRRFALPGISFRATALFAVLALLPPRSPAQTAAGPAPAPLEQQPAPASKTDAAPKPKAKAKPKRVYMNDDLQTRSAQVEEDSSAETDYYAGLLKCDASCEKQASTEVGLGHDGISGAAAWDQAMVISRKRLAADAEWREQLRKMIELLRIYCNYINPQTPRGTPGAKSYDARTFAEAEEYMKRTGRDLDASFQLLSAQMRTRVNEVRFPDPATGALMNVQFMRVSACAPYVP